jgi:ABC-type nitrate/sulfonate/bicarbonate transport system permease component
VTDLTTATAAAVRPAEDRAAAQRSSAGQSFRKVAVSTVERTALLVAVVLLWIFVGEQARPLVFPPLRDILRSAQDNWLHSDGASVYILPTIEHMLEGFALTAVVGVTIGVLLGRSAMLRDMLEPWIRLGMATPTIMLLPFAIAVFGLGTRMELLLVVSGTVWPVLVNTLDGVRSIDRTMLFSAATLRLSRRQIVFRVVIPAAMPRIISGLRASLALSLLLTVVAGMYAASTGLGSYIVQAQESFQPASLWSGIITVGLIGVVSNTLLLVVERVLVGRMVGEQRS